MLTGKVIYRGYRCWLPGLTGRVEIRGQTGVVTHQCELWEWHTPPTHTHTHTHTHVHTSPEKKRKKQTENTPQNQNKTWCESGHRSWHRMKLEVIIKPEKEFETCRQSGLQWCQISKSKKWFRLCFDHFNRPMAVFRLKSFCSIFNFNGNLLLILSPFWTYGHNFPITLFRAFWNKPEIPVANFPRD